MKSSIVVANAPHHIIQREHWQENRLYLGRRRYLLSGSSHARDRRSPPLCRSLFQAFYSCCHYPSEP